MARITFSNGTVVNFDGEPTQADIEEIAASFQSQPQQPQEQPNPYGAVFRATGQEGGLEAGLKAAGNVPTSAYNLGKNIVGAITSPVQTLKAVGGAVTDIGRTVMNATGMGKDRETPTLSALGGVLKDRYGSLENAQRTTIEDPFGVGADIVGILQGGAATVGKTAQLNNALSKTAQVATAPVRGAANTVARTASSATKFGASQATGLAPETMSTIVNNPKAFSAAKADGATRADLAQDVFGAIQKASDELGDLGSGYDSIRKSGQIVSLPDNWIKSSLDDFGFKFENGSVIADRTSKTRNTTDLTKIQAFVDNWGDSRNFTAEEYLNMRKDLADLAKYDQAGSTATRDFASRVREGVLNSDAVRGQVPGLKELDAQYSADIQFYNKMKKDYLNADGSLKDGAASKVVNAVNAANPERLARLERLYPGFTEQAKIIKAVEDVENSMGLKVGTYARAGVAITGVATANLPLILGAVLATPEVVIPLLKGLGYTAETIAPILKVIRDFASDINNFRVPGAVEAYIEKNYKDGIPVGLSVKRVTDDATLTDVGRANKLAEEAKKYKSAEEFVKAQPKVYHGTPETFDEFNTDITGDGAIWFTESVDEIRANKTGGVSKAGQKINEMERVIKPNVKLATGAIEDKANGSDDLIAQGYRGVVYPAGEYGDYTHTKLWFPNEDTMTRKQLEDIWKKANETKP